MFAPVTVKAKSKIISRQFVKRIGRLALTTGLVPERG